jgi:hypothetical protein
MTKKSGFWGILAVLLVLINCASAPRGEPSPFEGRWFVDTIEEAGTYTQRLGMFPVMIIFERNKFSLVIQGENSDGSLSAPVVLIAGDKFTYTGTDISVSDGADVFEYILESDRLTLNNETWGKVIWVRNDAPADSKN